MSPQPDNQAVPYAPAEVQAHLAALSRPIAPNQELSPLRIAAAVVTEFDPFALVPAESKKEITPLQRLDFLEELIQVPGNQQDKTLWALPEESRIATLKPVTSLATLKHVLKANKNRPQSRLQQRLDDLIFGKDFSKLESFSTEDLSSLVQIRSWFGDKFEKKLPGAQAIGEILKKKAATRILSELGDFHFKGRKEELAVLKAKLGAKDKKILFITGQGGMGKSALISRFILDELALRPAFVWARVDLDKATVNVHAPETILTEALRQWIEMGSGEFEREANIAAQYISRTSSRRLDSRESVHLESSVSSQDATTATEQDFISTVSNRTRLGRIPALLVLDTFEEAQFYGEDTEDAIMALLHNVSARLSNFHVIVLGRRAPSPRSYLETIHLGDLEPGSAKLLLGELVAERTPFKLDVALGSEVIGQIGGNPLTIKIAVDIIKNEGLAALKDIFELRKFSERAMQTRLYSRVLDHIHDKAVRDMAIPGFAVRLITPEVVQYVLAGPCGLGEITYNMAAELFRRIASEVTLVTPKGHQELIHRADVRQWMLAAMKEAASEKFEQVHRNAFQYWSNKPGPESQLEAFYHLLHLDPGPSELQKKWKETYSTQLRGAFDELPKASPVKKWLAEKLGVCLDASQRKKLNQSRWEAEIESLVRASIDRNQLKSALELFDERKKRNADSKLFCLRARLLIRMGRYKDAQAEATKGLGRGRRNGALRSELWSVASLARELQGDILGALKCNTKSAGVTGSRRYNSLESGVVYLRLMRKLWRSPLEGDREIGEIAQLAQSKGSRFYLTRPVLLSQAAAECGMKSRDLLSWALEQRREAIVSSLSRSQIISYAQRLDVPALETEIGGNDLESLRQKFGMYFEKILYDTSRRAESGLAFCELLQDFVASVMTKEDLETVEQRPKARKAPSKRAAPSVKRIKLPPAKKKK